MTLFLVIDLPNLSRSLHSVLYPRESARTAALEERITRTIGRYAIGAVVIATIAGTVQGTAAWILGVPFALALGIVAGLLGLIPQVGATLAAVVLSLVALTQGVLPAVIMLTVCIVYQQVENYVLQPTIQGRAADISGFFVIASVIVGAALLGVVGALIAVPLTASAQIVVRELTAERRAAVALAHAATAPAGGVTLLPRARPSRRCCRGSPRTRPAARRRAARRVAQPSGRLLERALERLVGERLDLAAVVADQVVMVVCRPGEGSKRATPSPTSTRWTRRSSASVSRTR